MKIQTEAEIEISVRCDDCGSELRTRKEEMDDGAVLVYVDACANCCNKHFNSGYEQAEKEFSKD